MSIPSIWNPTSSATNTPVQNTSELVGLSIPTPVDGYGVFVVDTGSGPGSGANFILSLTSGKTVDGSTVLPTSLGGQSRWLLQVSESPNAGISVVYKVGAVSPAAPFYASFSAAYLAGYKAGAPFTIWVDDSASLNNAVIDPLPGGAPYDLSRCALRTCSLQNFYGVGTGTTQFATPTKLTVLNGTIIPMWNVVDGLGVIPDVGVTNVITTVAPFPPQGYLFLINGAQFLANPNLAGGQPAFFRITGFLQVYVNQYSAFADTLTAGGSNPLCEIGDPVNGAGELDVYIAGDGPYVDVQRTRATNPSSPSSLRAMTVQLSSSSAQGSFATAPGALGGQFTFTNLIPASSRNYLWQPNSPTPGPDTYTTWDGPGGLAAALNAAPNGHRNVVVDATYGTPTIPAGDWVVGKASSTLTFEGISNVTTIGAQVIQIGRIGFADGVTIDGPRFFRFRNCVVNSNSAGQIFSDDSGAIVLIFEENSQLNQANPAGPFLLCRNHGANAVTFKDNTVCTTSGVAAFQSVGTGSAGGGMLVTLCDNASIGQFALKEDTPGLTLVVQTGLVTEVLPPQNIAISNIQGAIYCGSATIDGVTGKSPAITTDIYGQLLPITAKTKITLSPKTLVGDTNTKGYAILSTDRVNAGAGGGSFVVTALLSGGEGGAVNVADSSTVDWSMEVPNA